MKILKTTYFEAAAASLAFGGIVVLDFVLTLNDLTNFFLCFSLYVLERLSSEFSVVFSASTFVTRRFRQYTGRDKALLNGLENGSKNLNLADS